MKAHGLHGGMRGLAAALALALMPATAIAAGPATSGTSANSPAKLEDVPGSTVKRIVLTEKAVQRLGLETGKVSEERIVRRQMVGGLVIAPTQIKQPAPAGEGFGGFGQPAPQPAALQRTAAMKEAQAQKATWILVTLSHGEWERLAKDQPARLLPLATREQGGKSLVAKPSGMPPVEDSKRAMLNVYYTVDGAGEELQQNTRMRVELQMAGGDERRKAVPYSAVHYDAKGGAWVYLNPESLVYQRQQVRVERIVGDFAVLAEGPPVGTTVVTVGVAMLHGIEVFKK